MLIASHPSREEISRLLVANYSKILRITTSMCGKDKERGADIAQAVCQIALEPGHYHYDGNFMGWVRFKSAKLRKKDLRQLRREKEDPENFHVGRLVADGNPEQSTMSHEALRAIQKAMDALAPDQREAVNLIVLQGFSYEEAAAVMGVAQGSAKSRVNRGLSHMRELLAEHRPAMRAPKTACATKTL